MKRFCLVTLAFCLFTLMSQATILLDETFDYDVDSALGSVEGWTTAGDIVTGSGRTINAMILSYSNSGGEYLLSSWGKSLKNNYETNKTGNVAGANYVSSHSFPKVSSGVVYLSFLYKPDGNQSQSNGEIMGFAYVNSESSMNVAARVISGKIEGTETFGNPYRLGLSYQNNTYQWSSKELSTANTNLIVLKYDFDHQEAKLFINPIVGTEEEPEADATNSNGYSRSNLNTLIFQNAGASKSNYYVGGVRVSTTWAEAVEAAGTMPTDVTLESINTNFNDGTWGEVATTSYTSGSYPSGIINNFELNAAGMQSGTKTYSLTKEKFTNRISLDKQANGGMVTLPTLASCKEVSFFVSPGGDNRQVKLQKYNFIRKVWLDIETYTCLQKDTCYLFSHEFNSGEPTRLRIVNLGSGGVYIWKIQTISMTPEVALERVSLNFGDATWATIGSTATTTTIEDVVFTSCSRSTSAGYYTTTGQVFTGRIQMASSSMIELPAVASAAAMEIDVAAGTANRSIKIQKYNYYTSDWQDVQTLTCALASTYYRFVVTLNSESATRLRIVNADGGSKYVLKITTFADMPTILDVPAIGAATNVGTKMFTASWAPVSGASGYRVFYRYLKADGKWSNKVQEVNGPAATSVAITSNLRPDTTFYYQVAAIGDGVTTIDSELSEEKSFTTLTDPKAEGETITYTRAVTAGRYGTICLPRGAADVSTSGAIFYMIAGKEVDGGDNVTNVVMEEVDALEAGKPYVFLPSTNEISLELTGEVAESATTINGLAGSFSVKTIAMDANNYILSNNMLYCANLKQYTVGEYRAYFRMNQMSVYDSSNPAAAPAHRCARMAVAPRGVATDMDMVKSQDMSGWYDLLGRRIDEPTAPGLYIRNGQKILVQ